MFSYTITIGRNVGTEPMSAERWEDFIEDIKADMLLFAAESAIHVESVEIHRGKGTWEGVEEDSAKITILTPAQSDNTDILRHYLSETAWLYDQDAIALTIGMSHLIEKVTRTDFHTYGEDHQFTAADLRD